MKMNNFQGVLTDTSVSIKTTSFKIAAKHVPPSPTIRNRKSQTREACVIDRLLVFEFEVAKNRTTAQASCSLEAQTSPYSTFTSATQSLAVLAAVLPCKPTCRIGNPKKEEFSLWENIFFGVKVPQAHFAWIQSLKTKNIDWLIDTFLCIQGYWPLRPDSLSWRYSCLNWTNTEAWVFVRHGVDRYQWCTRPVLPF